MTQTEKEKRNEAIALFMGAKRHSFNIKDKEYFTFHFTSGVPFEKRALKSNDKGIVYAEYLEYSTSWDWLMPVVEKIEEQKMIVEIAFKECELYRPYEKDLSILTQGKTKIEAVFLAVSDYCLQFNPLPNE